MLRTVKKFKRITGLMVNRGPTAAGLSQATFAPGTAAPASVPGRAGCRCPRAARILRLRGRRDERLLVDHLLRGRQRLRREHLLPRARAHRQLGTPIAGREKLLNPNIVKVVFAADGGALYFSRPPTLHARKDDAGVREGTAASWYLRERGLSSLAHDVAAHQTSGVKLRSRNSCVRSRPFFQGIIWTMRN
jgi:hypothetical protein